MKSVLFRVDATRATGAGHLMRCIALAQEFQKQEASVTFLTSNAFTWLSQYLTSQQFRVQSHRLPDIQLGGDIDLKATITEAKDAEWVVLDNYYFDGVFQKSIRELGKRVLVIDDFPNREFHADVLLNHGMGAEVVQYAIQENTKFLLGSHYALIRSELQQRAAQLKPKAAKNILITLGGGDQVEVLKKLSGAFALVKELDLHAIAVASSQIPGIECRQPSADAYELYEWADLAVCAGGGTTSELCLYGIPGIVGSLAENQEPNVESLSRKGIFDSVGSYASTSPEELAAAIRNLVKNPARIEEMRRKAKKLIDGHGAYRVYQAMQEVACEVH